PNELNVTRILAIVKQTALAIQHVTGQNIVSGDISADNILLDERDQVKLSDFGGAAQIGQMVQAYNMHYSAPEIIYRGMSTETSDVYSLGVIIVQLITRQATEELGEVPKNQLKGTAQGSTGKKKKKEKGQSSKADEVSHVSIQTEQAIRTQRYNIHPDILRVNQEDGRTARTLLELANTCMRFHANQRPRIQDVVRRLADL
ncbi:UNVERIFIED_CONTAM: Ribosomal protein S6 kinase-related protein, partial [Sesamum angustifolium]